MRPGVGCCASFNHLLWLRAPELLAVLAVASLHKILSENEHVFTLERVCLHERRDNRCCEPGGRLPTTHGGRKTRRESFAAGSLGDRTQ